MKARLTKRYDTVYQSIVDHLDTGIGNGQSMKDMGVDVVAFSIMAPYAAYLFTAK